MARIKSVIEGFDWKKKKTKVLFKKKLTEKILQNMDAVWNNILEIKEKENYRNYKIKIDESANIILSAEVVEGEHFEKI